MPVHPLKIVAGLFAAGLLACAPAHAAYANASISLNNMQFQLIDLDLTDNITPSITFEHVDSYGGTYYSAGTDSDSKGFEGAGTVSVAYANGSGSASATDTSLHAGMHTSLAAPNLRSETSVRQFRNFTLSPMTRLTFSAQADAFGDQAGIDRAWSIAYINASMQTVINGVDGYEGFSSSMDFTKGTRSRLLHGSIDTGASIGTGMLTAATLIEHYHWSTVTPVPEPASYGMLMAGLLVLGGVARRKARKA